jgi:hypothetical protein
MAENNNELDSGIHSVSSASVQTLKTGGLYWKARFLAYIGLNVVFGVLLATFFQWHFSLDWHFADLLPILFTLSIPPLVATPILMLAYHLVMKGIPVASRKGRRARLVTFAGFAAFLLGSIAYTMVFSLGFGIPV